MLLALVDSHCNFLFIDVGSNGRISDGGVYRESKLNSALTNNSLNIPNQMPPPGSDLILPFVVVADDAFPLRDFLLKPYSRRNLTNDERHFNYRLSKARQVVERAFGLLAVKFRVLHSKILLSPDRCEKIVLACCVLHNFLNKRRLEIGDLPTFLPITNQGSNSSTIDAKTIRDKFKKYVCTEGRL